VKTQFWFTLAILLVVAPALAQSPPATAEHEETAADRWEHNLTRFRLTAGSSLTWGNARALAFNLGGAFELKRDIHGVLAEIGWVYGVQMLRDMMMPPVYGPLNESANNLTWRARYDLFVTQDDVVFMTHRGRRDPFASLDPRISFQVGYMRNFFREDHHRFWGELGYDLTYDHFLTPVMLGPTLRSDRLLHSLRAFIGYENALNELLTYRGGFEWLMNLELPEHMRMEWTNQLRSKIMEWLEIALDFTLRVDSRPPGQLIAWNDSAASSVTGIQMVDVLSTLNLVGTFDLEREQEEEAAAEEPPACPPPPVCPDCSPPAPEVVTEPDGETTDAPPEDAPPAPATTTEQAPAPAP
jgi:hypothetical protein